MQMSISLHPQFGISEFQLFSDGSGILMNYVKDEANDFSVSVGSQDWNIRIIKLPPTTKLHPTPR